ncbi:MAG TPA: hypothetical protein PKH10_06330 [bacterium]|nr:hypothetical protein [bacterium]
MSTRLSSSPGVAGWLLSAQAHSKKSKSKGGSNRGRIIVLNMLASADIYLFRFTLSAGLLIVNMGFSCFQHFGEETVKIKNGPIGKLKTPSPGRWRVHRRENLFGGLCHESQENRWKKYPRKDGRLKRKRGAMLKVC